MKVFVWTYCKIPRVTSLLLLSIGFCCSTNRFIKVEANVFVGIRWIHVQMINTQRKEKQNVHTFPLSLTSGWLPVTVGSYLPCPCSCLLPSFTMPLVSSASLINWTTSHYYPFQLCIFWARLVKAVLADVAHLYTIAEHIIIIFCFYMVYGKFNYSNYRPELALVWGFETNTWTSEEQQDSSLFELFLFIYSRAIVTDWPWKNPLVGLRVSPSSALSSSDGSTAFSAASLVVTCRAGCKKAKVSANCFLSCGAEWACWELLKGLLLS